MNLREGAKVTFIIRNQWYDPYMLVMRPQVVISRTGVDGLGNPQYWVRHNWGMIGPSDVEYGPFRDGELLDGWVVGR